MTKENLVGPARQSTIEQLARIVDPLAYDERAETRTLGQRWDQTHRRMTAELHARRALAAGWAPPKTAPAARRPRPQTVTTAYPITGINEGSS